jgi:sugar/nucleoside kinase (ribokinase family)
MTRKAIDILCAGELLVDMITAEFAQTLEEVTLFKRIPGGSPANLCMNMARLGNNGMLVSTVGNDDMGQVLKDYVAQLGVDVSSVAMVDEAATTLILVTRSATVSNFQQYRGADSYLSIRQFPYVKFEDLGIFHTTCFALSKAPAQDVIMDAAERARRSGAQLSIDANYAPKIWPDRTEAQRLVSAYCRMGALVKISDVDWERLYGEKGEPQAVLEHFLKIGAREVCFTLGSEGCWVGNGTSTHFVPAREVEVKDTTGAGDAFWSGYLTARLDGKSILACAMAGRKMAELKLQHFGPLPNKVERNTIYADLNE